MDRIHVDVGELRSKLLTQSTIDSKYHSVINTAMSTHTKETNDTTVMSQMTAMTAQHQEEMVALREQMMGYLTSSGTPAPAPPPPPSTGDGTGCTGTYGNGDNRR